MHYENTLNPPSSSFAKPQNSILLESTQEDSDYIKSASASNQNIGKVIYMGICFIFLFTAASAQALVGEIYQQLGYNSLGIINLLIQSATAGIGVLVIPGLIKTWQYKTGVVVGAVGTILALVAGVLTTSCDSYQNEFWCTHSGYIYVSNIVCSVIQGFTAPILWLCVNRYITGCANPYNKGKFMGLFSALYTVSSITGSLSSSLIIKHYGQFDYYIAGTVAAIVFTSFFFFAPHVEKYVEENQTESTLQKAVNILSLSFSKRMRPLLLYMFYVGLLGSAVSGFQYKIILSTVRDMSQPDQDSLTADILLVQGGIQIVASFVGGKLADMFKKNPVLYLFNLFQGLALVMGLLSYLYSSLGLSYVMGAFWGFGNYGAYTLVYVIMAQDFDGSIEAYAVPQLMSPLASAIGYGLCIAFGDKIVPFLIFLGAVLIITQISTCFYKSRNTLGQKNVGHGY